MRLPQTKLQRIKAIVHFVQAFVIFIAGCLTLAVMTKDGGFGGQTGFYFALCFITIPAIIYQVMVPLWSRAWRFNNVWAIATVDILFAILWFAASIAVAVWNANGIAKGKSSDSKDDSDENTRRDDSTKKDGTCASFGYGSATKCSISKASVGLGIVIMLLFAITSYISIRAIIEYRRTGVAPNATAKNHGQPERLDVDDPSKDVWSANTDELNNRTNNDDDRLAFGQDMEDDQQGLLNRHSFDTHQPADGMHPGTRLSYESTTQVAAPPAYDSNIAPSALSPTGLPMSPNGRVQFPEANYNALR
ncbi:hypothetical protein M409DRAFT_63806 [Zasmidium cellare ATCC 36951]|uniref:MARVEL domain-containing protein n=1 Tax=Zasmidium cellare ATCC 36951 TaxID=1080233 RepID=A0A6A6CUK1_ZASCE|nr:uncharacterized protein M409DRAFT_63806 [Zasmidium cellare ATCC 36951]KAF2170725.1 hypothetical protein M409DRAFT_63806 [Zasmidium cellare ATCC 36951]